VLFRPFEHGVDITVYSVARSSSAATARASAGASSTRATSTGRPTEKWPQFTEPDPSYHGAVFQKAVGQLCYIITCRTHWLRDLGGCMSPFNAFLFPRGWRRCTCGCRGIAHNAQQVAEYLDAHDAVIVGQLPRAWTITPTGPTRRSTCPPAAARSSGSASRAARRPARRFIEACKLCSHLANIGDAKTLVIHPASTTHSQQTEAELAGAGVSPDYIRVSVGLEDFKDIKADLEQALAASQG
jgi:O-acetylhomoserine (thiol)-lyase